ncbi:beta-N-acetylhexosaminidase, partial [Pseudomonas aeruginosa]
LAAGCDIGLECHDWASDQLAVRSLQHLKVIPQARLQRLRGNGSADAHYCQQPRGLEAVSALRDAQLID